MDISHIFDQLNEAQREAVALEPRPALVLAGAGSGKTRVLTSRVTFLVQMHQISPLSILAVTFTNKAAREMRERIERTGLCMGCHQNMTDEDMWSKVNSPAFVTNDEHKAVMDAALKAYAEEQAKK